MDNCRLLALLFVFTSCFNLGSSNNIPQNGTDLNTTTIIVPTVSACDGQGSNLTEASEQLTRYTTCLQPNGTKHSVYPFVCSEYQTMVQCFLEYTNSVSSCYADVLPDWKKTGRVLKAVFGYLCAPSNEPLSDFFHKGSKGCIPSELWGNCGESLLTILLNSTSYPELSNPLLTLSHTEEKCRADNDNAKCYIDQLDLYCKETPSVADIASKAQDIIVKESECNIPGGARSNLISSYNVGLVLVGLSFSWILTKV